MQEFKLITSFKGESLASLLPSASHIAIASMLALGRGQTTNFNIVIKTTIEYNFMLHILVIYLQCNC